jgi:hypothetical protein
MWHEGLEVLNEVTKRIILLRDVTIFCLVDIDHLLRKTGWFYLPDIRKAKLFPKVRNGVLIWNISGFLHKQWLVTSQNKESVRYHGKVYIKVSQIFLKSLLLFFSRHVSGTISLISAPQYIMYLKRAYYIPKPISQNISLLIKLQKSEQNWTKSS